MHPFRTSRHFSMPPGAVFAAFASPARLARWWGPDGFRNTFDTFEFRPGGSWRFTMHGPDGNNYPNVSTFMEIEPDRRIVVRHLSAPHFDLSIEFSAAGDGTLVTWTQIFEDADVAAAVAHIVEPSNEQNLNRWQAELAADAAVE